MRLGIERSEFRCGRGRKLTFSFSLREIGLIFWMAVCFLRDKHGKRTKSYPPPLPIRMTPGFTRLLQVSTCSAFLLLIGCAATGSGPVTITKVNPYHLQGGPLIKTDDQMIDFEQHRHLHGAVENTERRELYGNYFTIFWKSETKAPATVRFEYRQGSTGLKVYTQEIEVSAPKRRNVTKLEVTGNDYHRDGKVTQWKASIVENGTVVAEYKSYLWQ